MLDYYKCTWRAKTSYFLGHFVSITTIAIRDSILKTFFPPAQSHRKFLESCDSCSKKSRLILLFAIHELWFESLINFRNWVKLDSCEIFQTREHYKAKPQRNWKKSSLNAKCIKPPTQFQTFQITPKHKETRQSCQIRKRSSKSLPQKCTMALFTTHLGTVGPRLSPTKSPDK